MFRQCIAERWNNIKEHSKCINSYQTRFSWVVTLGFLLLQLSSGIEPSIRVPQTSYFFSASAAIDFWIQALVCSAISFIFSGSFFKSCIVCLLGTFRPFSTPGRESIRASHFWSAGNSVMSIPAQKAAVTHPQCEISATGLCKYF